MKIQLENATGRADLVTPYEYIKTEGSTQYATFGNKNGNSVDPATDIVTEATSLEFNDRFAVSDGYTLDGQPRSDVPLGYDAPNHNGITYTYYLEALRYDYDRVILSVAGVDFLKIRDLQAPALRALVPYYESDAMIGVSGYGVGDVSPQHPDEIYALCSDGFYYPFPIDKPVWEGGRWLGNGTVSAYDEAGVALDVKLVAQGEATNEVLWSRDLTNALWTGTATSLYTEVGLDGTPNSASNVADDDPTAYKNIAKASTVPSDNVISTVIVYIKKDSDESRFPEIQYLNFGGVFNIQLNTKTGETTERASSGNNRAFYAIDLGTWWKVFAQVEKTNSTTSLSVAIQPAVTTVFGIAEASAIGSVIIGNVELHFGKTIAEVRDLAPIFTTTAPVTTGAITNTLDGTNHSDSEGGYYLEAKCGGVDQDVLSIGGEAMLKVESGDVGNPELIVNGGFDTSDNWDLGQGVSISGGKALFINSGLNQRIEQPPSIVGLNIGDEVLVSFDLVSIDPDQSLHIRWPFNQLGVPITEIGKYEMIGVVEDESCVIRAGQDGTNATIDNISIVNTGKILTLTDGTNQASLPIAAGSHQIAVAYDAGAGTMALNLDGAWSSDSPYDGSFGAGQMTLGATMGKLYRHKKTTLAEQKARLDEQIAGTDYSDYEIVATDGVNEVVHKMPEGASKVGLVYDQAGNSLSLNANGVWGADTPFLGLPDAQLDVRGGYRGIEGYNLSGAPAKAKIDEIIAGTAPPPPIPSVMTQLGCDQALANYQNGRYKDLSIGEGEYTAPNQYLTDNSDNLLVDNDGNLLTEK